MTCRDTLAALTIGMCAAQPAELLPTPAGLVGGVPPRARTKPPLLAKPFPLGGETSARGGGAPSAKPGNHEDEANLHLTDSCRACEARADRCLKRLPDGRLAAVPLPPAALSADFARDGDETVMVEVQGPCSQLAWLEDSRADLIEIPAGASSAASSWLLPRERVKAFVHGKINLRQSCRGLGRARPYKLCAPLPQSSLRVVLVPAADLAELKS